MSLNEKQREEFNNFIKKWCGSNASHLLDNDENDGERFRQLLDTHTTKAVEDKVEEIRGETEKLNIDMEARHKQLCFPGGCSKTNRRLHMNYDRGQNKMIEKVLSLPSLINNKQEWKCVCKLTLPFWGANMEDGNIRCKECKRVWTKYGLEITN